MEYYSCTIATHKVCSVYHNIAGDFLSEGRKEGMGVYVTFNSLGHISMR